MNEIKNLFSTLIILTLIILFNKEAFTENFQTKNSFLSANSIEYHDEISLITALGDVEIINGPDILRAYKDSYDMESDNILAVGRVSLQDGNNNIFSF